MLNYVLLDVADMSKEESLSKAELYKLHSTQLLLGKFISEEIDKLDRFMTSSMVIDTH